ncbi:MAG: VWA domain-containing protein [Promethearchaeota archaeon]
MAADERALDPPGLAPGRGGWIKRVPMLDFVQALVEELDPSRIQLGVDDTTKALKGLVSCRWTSPEAIKTILRVALCKDQHMWEEFPAIFERVFSRFVWRKEEDVDEVLEPASRTGLGERFPGGLERAAPPDPRGHEGGHAPPSGGTAPNKGGGGGSHARGRGKVEEHPVTGQVPRPGATGGGRNPGPGDRPVDRGLLDALGAPPLVRYACLAKPEELYEDLLSQVRGGRGNPRWAGGARSGKRRGVPPGAPSSSAVGTRPTIPSGGDPAAGLAPERTPRDWAGAGGAGRDPTTRVGTPRALAGGSGREQFAGRARRHGHPVPRGRPLPPRLSGADLARALRDAARFLSEAWRKFGATGAITRDQFGDIARRLRRLFRTIEVVERREAESRERARERVRNLKRLVTPRRPGTGLGAGGRGMTPEPPRVPVTPASGSLGKRYSLCDAAREIGRMLATREAARYRKRERGRLHFKRVVRSSLKYQGSPVKLHFRVKRLLKPKLLLLCDVSGSVKRHIPFMLSFFHEFSQVFTHIKTFLFVDRPVDVSETFERSGDPERAFQAVLSGGRVNIGGWSDFGAVFRTFRDRHFELIDHNTVLVVAGDARNNHRPKALREFYEMSRAARMTIWLNPEDESQWNRGDSIMDYYALSCDHVLQVSSPRDLYKVIATKPFRVSAVRNRRIRLPP